MQMLFKPNNKDRIVEKNYEFLTKDLLLCYWYWFPVTKLIANH
jgi:hypothetical protein